MSWLIRHEGSTRSVPVATVEEIHQGLADGLWTPEDEVQAPGETTWTALSSHPATEDAAAEVEPPEPTHYEDESNLDMTALIDVCLVLLIFFMMLVGYTAMQKRIESARAGKADAGNVREVAQPEAEQSMVWLKITFEDGKSVYVAETTDNGQRTTTKLDPADLKTGLGRLIKAGRSTLLLDHQDNVPHGDVVKAQDAGTGLRMKIALLMKGP